MDEKIIHFHLLLPLNFLAGSLDPEMLLYVRLYHLHEIIDLDELNSPMW
jgi:hypothetical protein